MSIQGKKSVDHSQINNLKFFPLVQTKDGTYLFHPEFIYQSLLKETSISKSNAQKVTDQAIRFLISAKLNIITAPLIREVVNVHLLKNGFEKERLQ
ncbi:MAG: anaerobic ribonucleoside-triphosphate reductase, partial [Candidatus Odinarchaeota archaeon]